MHLNNLTYISLPFITMKNLILIFLFACSNLAFSQHIFKVDNFSKDYYGKVNIEDPNEVFNKGWIAIYDKKTN